MIGQKVSHYHIVARLEDEEGGEVYKATDSRTGRYMVLRFLPKEFARDAKAMDRFLREARAVAALKHTNVSPIRHIGEHAGRYFVVTELLPGQTLTHLLSGKPLSRNLLLLFATQIADGLQAAHLRGIVHGNIRPDKIFITEGGEAKILDFGLRRLTPGPHQVREGVRASGPPAARGAEPAPHALPARDAVAYMSPEQGLGEEVDTRSDLYSFGVLLYEMATGRLPYDGNTREEVLDAILHKLPPSPRQLNPQLPEELEQIITTALSKYRELGYQSAAVLGADLRRLKGETAPRQPVRSRRQTQAGPLEVTRVGTAPAPASEFEEEARAAAPFLSRSNLSAMLVLVAVFLVVTVASFYYWRWADALTEEDQILVAEVVNQTDEPIFDGTLRSALAVKLRESPFFNVVSDEEMWGAVERLGHSPDRSLSPAVAYDVCRRQGIKAMLQGWISKPTDNYIVTLATFSCSGGYALAGERAEASGRGEVLDVLGRAAVRLRGKLGESFSSMEKYDVPVRPASSSSLEALQAFALGAARQAKGRDAQALRSLRTAIRLDPKFALAHARLGALYDRLGESQPARQHKKRAFDLRERVSELDRFALSASYYRDVVGEIEQEFEVYDRWSRAYPRDWRPRARLASYYSTLGEFQEAVDEAREARRLAPNQPLPAVNLARAYVGSRLFEDAREVCEEMLAEGLESGWARSILYSIAFVEGDEEAMGQQVLAAKGKPGESALLATQASAAAFWGRLQKSRELYGQAIAQARRSDSRRSAATLAALEALTEAEVGNYQRAREIVAQALPRGAPVQPLAVLALARAGDVGRAQRLSNDLARRFPRDTLLHSLALPTIRAHIEIHRGNPREAIDLLQAARPYELGMPADFPSFAAIYVRGQAYMLAGEIGQAIVEFRKILDHRGLDPVSPFYALAHLRLARAYGLAAAEGRRRLAYEDFLDLWRNADPDVPILLEAKAEFALLR
jgi:tetratricopeptide (TPR) repeat protein